VACSRVNFTFHLLLCTQILHFSSLHCPHGHCPALSQWQLKSLTGDHRVSSGVSFCSQKKMIIISFDVINKTDIFKGKAVHFLGGRVLLQMYSSSRPRLAVGINTFTSQNQSQRNSHLKTLTNEMPQRTKSQYQFLSTEKVIK
jgi:hypothetical protein